MKFSIVIPCYKVEKYLHECVDSIINQSYKDFEIILVDDGSPDRCPQICDEYTKKDKRIKVVHQKNAGLACARNAGIKIAKGEYLICIDSDDYMLDEHVLQKLDTKTVSNPDVVLYGYKKLYESDGSWGAAVTPIDIAGDAHEVILKQLQNDSFTATAWTKVVRVDLLQKNEVLFTPGLISEDNDWYMRLLCYAKRIVGLSEPCIAYRQRPGSISHDAKLNSLTDNLWILETWPERFKELGAPEQMRSTLLSALTYFYANLLIVFVGYKSSVSSPYKQRLQQLSYLFDYAITPRALTEKRFVKLIGFNNTLWLLKILSKLKKRQ